LPLAPPPRDANGGVIPHDHQGILSEDGIIRRVSEHQVIHDQRRGCRRISSIAFKASSEERGGMSVDLQREIEEAGLDARVYVSSPRWIGSLRFVARDLRAIDLKIGYDPINENPYHGEVWGDFGKAQQDEMRQHCEWFVEIPGVAIR
jgi:hypothetical protein